MAIFKKEDMEQEFIDKLVTGTDEVYLLESFFVDEAIQNYILENKDIRDEAIRKFIRKVNTIPVRRRI